MFVSNGPTVTGAMIHDPERVKAIRNTVATAQQVISDLEDRIEDAGIREYLGMAHNFLGDVESVFLGRLTDESRTANEEARWLDGAELALQLAAHYRKLVKDIFAKYGPNVRAVG